MHVRSLAGIACAAILGLVPATAQAQFTTYTSLASYLAAISGPATDTYDDLAPLGSQGTGELNRTVGAYSYRATNAEFFTVGTIADVWLSSNFVGSAITLNNFSSNVRGVGGYVFSTDIDGFVITPSRVIVRYANAGGTFTSTLTNPTSSSFFGVTSSSAITSFEVVDQTDGGGWSTINDLVLGGSPSVVPEPATYALVAAGLAVMGVASKRRRKN